MIALKFVKKGAAAYVSHVDLIRQIQRTLRRMGAEVEYSKGFNPHMDINMSVPLPVGIESEAEYFTAALNMPSKEFLSAYNAFCAPGLEGVKAFSPIKAPNLAGKAAASDFFITAEGAEEVKKELENIINLPSYLLTYHTQKGEETKDVGGRVYGLKTVQGGLMACLAAGSFTVRPDRLAAQLSKDYGITAHPDKIIRTAQYVLSGNLLVPADEYLEVGG